MAVWLRRNLVLLEGILVGIMGALLVKFGNPANMGLCFVCFYRDISGARGWAASPAGVPAGGWLALAAGYAVTLSIAGASTFARVAARRGACDV